MEGLEPLTTNNNLMDLAQLSGCAFCYLELKFGKEYFTMEMTKVSKFELDSKRVFRVEPLPKCQLSAMAIKLPSPESL